MVAWKFGGADNNLFVPFATFCKITWTDGFKHEARKPGGQTQAICHLKFEISDLRFRHLKFEI